MLVNCAVNRTHILLLGDSIAIHYAPWLRDYLGSGYQLEMKSGMVEALADLDHPQGMNCGNSAMVREYLAQRLPNSLVRPDLVVINFGLHDMKSDPVTEQNEISLGQYKANCQSVRNQIEQQDLKGLWVRTTGFDEKRHNQMSPKKYRFSRDLAAYNQVADEAMAGWPVADLYDFTLRQGNDLYCDHVHFKEPIRALQGKFLAHHIQEILPSPVLPPGATFPEVPPAKSDRPAA